MHCTATVRVWSTAALNKKEKLALLLLSVQASNSCRSEWFFCLLISAGGITYSEFANALRRLLQCVTPACCPCASPLQLCTHREGLLARKRLAGERQRPVCHDCGEPRVRSGLLQACHLRGMSADGCIGPTQRKFKAAKGHLRHTERNDAASRLAAVSQKFGGGVVFCVGVLLVDKAEANTDYSNLARSQNIRLSTSPGMLQSGFNNWDGQESHCPWFGTIFVQLSTCASKINYPLSL